MRIARAFAALALAAGALLAGLPAVASLIPPGGAARHEGDRVQPLAKGLAGLDRVRGPARPPYPMRVTVAPSPARLGQRLAYRASIIVEPGTRVRMDRPQQGGDLSWGAPRTGRTSVTSVRLGQGRYAVAGDSVWLEAPLQVFATGTVAVPGLAVEVRWDGGERPAVTRMPTAHLVVLPTLTAADSNARLRSLHGPLRAPWWERVPWRWVAAVALLVIVAVIVLIRLLRPKRIVAPPPVAVRPPPVRDPGTEALAELARLRALRLPEAGRFADHAFELSRILHRYLEAVVGTPRPGDTSGELVERLRQSRLPGEDVNRLEGLLGLWDRVKFARAPLGVDEAVRCESAVESLVRREQRGAA